VAGDLRRLYNEKFRNIVPYTNYCWGDQIKEDKMDGTCSTHGRGEKFTKYFV